jgi:hypothetical protein
MNGELVLVLIIHADYKHLSIYIGGLLNIIEKKKKENQKVDNKNVKRRQKRRENNLPFCTNTIQFEFEFEKKRKGKERKVTLYVRIIHLSYLVVAGDMKLFCKSS